MIRILTLLIIVIMAINPVNVFGQYGYEEPTPAPAPEPTPDFQGQVSDANQDINSTLGQIDSKLTSFENIADDFVANATSENLVNQVDVIINDIKSQLNADIQSKLNAALADPDKAGALDQAINDAQAKLSQIDGFLGQSNNKINQIKNELQNFASQNNFTNTNPAFSDFIIQANELNKQLLIDVQNAPAGTVNTTEFLNDFNTLKTETENFMRSLNTQLFGNSGQVNPKFNPSKFLDRGFESPLQKPLELEILGFGIDNRFSQQQVITIIEKMRGKFLSDSSFQSDVDFFLASFRATEVVLMQASEANVFQTASQLKNNNGGSTKFFVDAFGKIRTKQNTAEDNAEFSNNVLISDTIDQRFNSRTFGGSDGTFRQLQLTSQDRTFALSDNIFTSPIVLDLDGDGQLEASNGEWMPHQFNDSTVVEFDIDGDQFPEFVEWVGKNDGLLMVRKEGEEVNGLHLFGEAGGFTDGYEKLSAYDKNNDKVLNGEEIKNFSVWQDVNQNGKAEKGEVKTVAELGITEINVTHSKLVSSFVQNGQKKNMWDWYPCIFRVKRTS